MVKHYLREYEGEGEGEDISIKETLTKDLKEAQTLKKSKQVIHVCYHDEGNGEPCKLI